MTDCLHDSQDPFYRFPQGPVPAGSALTLRLRAGGPVTSAFARIWWDSRETRYAMRPAGGGVYEATVSLPDTPGILWYFLILETDRGLFYAGNAADRLGGRCEMYDYEPPSYQVTLYAPDYQTPSWMRESVMMQIMVDRFYKGAPNKGKQLGRGGYFHKSWREHVHLRVGGPDEEAVDFFGGDLKGLKEKLPYLHSMGITALYLNPVFQARSNHKYDTGDYKKIDPSFGTEADFIALTQAAKCLGIRVILDGVFSHTGADSRYFNRFATYDGAGAYQSPDSPYAKWYRFTRYPDEYDCWWGFPTLPNVNELEPSYMDFILGDEDAVIKRWLDKGASGWRLDVADELPMPFLREIRRAVKAKGADNAVIGEVWDDPTNKISYGAHRSYALGDTCDSTMNYPLREALLSFMTFGASARHLARRLNAMRETIPAPMLYSMMNLLGSHDKPRVISVLSGEKDLEPPREMRRAVNLSARRYETGRKRFLALWKFVCCLPGMPCLYYGDEAGMTGMADPFCRETYPWGFEDKGLLEEIRAINALRLSSSALKTGDMRVAALSEDAIMIVREIRGGRDALQNPRENERRALILNRADVPFAYMETVIPPVSAEFVEVSKP